MLSFPVRARPGGRGLLPRPGFARLFSSFFPRLSGVGWLRRELGRWPAQSGRRTVFPPLFFPSTQDSSWKPGRRHARSAASSRFFASPVEAAIEGPPGGGLQHGEGLLFSSVFPAFPVARQDQARVDLAVKARRRFFADRMSLFFLEARAVAAEERAAAAEAAKARLSSGGVGRGTQICFCRSS